MSEDLLACPFCKSPIVALDAISEHLWEHSGALRGWCGKCKRALVSYGDGLFIQVYPPGIKIEETK